MTAVRHPTQLCCKQTRSRSRASGVTRLPYGSEYGLTPGRKTQDVAGSGTPLLPPQISPQSKATEPLAVRALSNVSSSQSTPGMTDEGTSSRLVRKAERTTLPDSACKGQRRERRVQHARESSEYVSIDVCRLNRNEEGYRPPTCIFSLHRVTLLSLSRRER